MSYHQFTALRRRLQTLRKWECVARRLKAYLKLTLREFVTRHLKKFETQVGTFLNSLHKQGLINNDVRLANIVLIAANRPEFRVVDFEITRFAVNTFLLDRSLKFVLVRSES